MTSTKWVLPANLIASSIKVMRPNGVRGHEGLAIWLGDKHDDVVTITHVLSLIGPGLVAGPLQLRLSLGAVARITSLTDELQAYWVGQIHSHPGRYIDLSPVDKAMGVKVQDYLSVVCPHYAQLHTEHLNDCGVHVFDKGAYRRMPQKEVFSRLLTVEQHAPVIRLEVPA